MFAVVAKLLTYHLKIIYKNLTTYQEIKRTYVDDIDYFFRRYKINYIVMQLVNEYITKYVKSLFLPFLNHRVNILVLIY